MTRASGVEVASGASVWKLARAFVVHALAMLSALARAIGALAPDACEAILALAAALVSALAVARTEQRALEGAVFAAVARLAFAFEGLLGVKAPLVLLVLLVGLGNNAVLNTVAATGAVVRAELGLGVVLLGRSDDVARGTRDIGLAVAGRVSSVA